MPDLAVCLEPVPGDVPGGRDARHEAEHERVRGEIEKLSGVRGGMVDWQLIQRDAQVVLQRKSKDLLIAAYLGLAWAALEGCAGLACGIRLLASLLERYPDCLQPRRSRARANALSWFAERAAQLPGIEGCSVEGAAELREAYGALLAGARAVLPDECPSLSELGRSIERAALSAHTTAASAAAPPAAGAVPAPAAVSTPVPAVTPVSASTSPFTSSAAAVPAPPVAVPAAAFHPTHASTTAPVAASAAALAGTTAPAHPDIPPSVPAITPSSAAAALLLPAPVPAPVDTSAVAPYLIATATGLVDAARALLEADATQPRPYRLLRVGLWLELESLPPAQGDGRTRVRAPERRLREALAGLFSAARWDALLLQSEASLRTNPLWLDACWLSARALEALGESHRAAAMAVECESRALIERLPQLLELRFMDGTPVASPETAAWLRARSSGGESAPAAERAAVLPKALQSALEAVLGAGDVGAQRELERALRAAPSARAAFQWRLAIGRSAESAGKLEAAAALYLSLERELDAHRLEDWEPELARELLGSLAALARRKASLLAAPDAQRVCVRLARLSPFALT